MYDLTSIWAFWQKHKRYTNPALLLLVAFTAGWQVNKIVSPYNTAAPIIFEECSEEVLGLKKTDQTIEKLKAEGIAARDKTTKKTEVSQDTKAASKKNIAGTTTNDVTAAEEAPPTSSATGKFVGSVNSDLFHDPSCSSSKRIKPANQIWFDSIPDAEAAGYSPSKCTREKLGI